MLGFGLLFLGLMLLKGSVESLKESQMAVGIFTMFSHNLLLAVGAGVDLPPLSLLRHGMGACRRTRPHL